MRVKDILALPPGLCMDGQDVVGSTFDGGIPGFGAVGYVVCEDNVTKEKTSKLACSKSKISKRTVPAVDDSESYFRKLP